MSTRLLPGRPSRKRTHLDHRNGFRHSTAGAFDHELLCRKRLPSSNESTQNGKTMRVPSPKAVHADAARRTRHRRASSRSASRQSGRATPNKVSTRPVSRPAAHKIRRTPCCCCRWRHSRRRRRDETILVHDGAQLELANAESVRPLLLMTSSDDVTGDRQGCWRLGAT
jgi:hypothetical protein